MSIQDRNKKILMDLVQLPGNNTCADCGAPDPDWASCSLGVFVCLDCSGFHRSLTSMNRVKSIRLDFWDDEMVKFMKTNGNEAAKIFYERDVPPFYYRPQQKDSAVLRDQWIKAKYERQEFTGDNRHRQEIYSSGFYEGRLWKKAKDNGQFLKRKFTLSDSDFTLKYYTKDDLPRAIISIKSLNATFQPEKIGHQNGLQIMFQDAQRSQNLFVYHDSGQEIVNWFNAIRAARFAYLKTAFPMANDSELSPRITRNYLKEGYMEKTGPMQRETFRKRWFILDGQERKLLYFKTKLDAVELGAVFIGPETLGYSAAKIAPRGTRGNRWKFGVTMETPDRQFVFMCEREREQGEWLEALKVIISKPMLPQDYATEANLRRRR
ncbi:arf-GAP with dual PH domain-containing protein 2 isoform X2 [Paramormyrops kingsleyae]|uniref:arf-GAP with dual PH domain-containing protein 2 isoform X2 n=1 Tax=Paramormyrops kingsleyae TaxID=1676925 RepID=UPI003B96D6C6